MIRINNIKIKDNLDKEDILKIGIENSNIKLEDILNYKIHKKSIDARKKEDVHYNYSLDICLKNKTKETNLVKNQKNIEFVKEIQFPKISINCNKDLNVVVIGAGPAGLFSAITLVDNGIKPIIIEQGSKVEDRTKDVESFIKTRILNEKSNIQFGEGGAGTFSDGKLNTGSNNIYAKSVLKTFVKFGAPEEILYVSKPHIGTDNLTSIVKNMRNYIISKGGQVIFNKKVIDFNIEDNKIKSIIAQGNEIIKCDKLILAIGNSSRDTFKKIYEKGLNLKIKNFAVGVRIEHLQKDIDFSQYGNNYNKFLPSAEYKLVKHLSNGRTCYTFCMCPGGTVVPATSCKNKVVTNGMSKFLRNEINSNSALLVNITEKDLESKDVLSGIKFQEDLEKKAYILGGNNYNAPIQRVEDFLNNKTTIKLGKIKPSYLPDITYSNLNDILPQFIAESLKEGIKEMGKNIKGFDDKDAILTGVETRTSSPVQIIRDSETLMSNILNIYPCGEGAGYAGGITTSAIDGIKCALSILESKAEK